MITYFYSLMFTYVKFDIGYSILSPILVEPNYSNVLKVFPGAIV